MVMSLDCCIWRWRGAARRFAFELAKMAAEGSLPYLNVYDVVHEHCGENTVELLPSDEIFLFEHPKRDTHAAAHRRGGGVRGGEN